MANKELHENLSQLIRALEAESPPSQSVRAFLSGLSGESSEWPTDAALWERWHSAHVYQTLQNARVVYILKRLGDSYRSSKSEDVTVHTALSIEHILPQNWFANWPLEDGSTGMSAAELWDAKPDDPRALATRRRNALLQTFGNLTALTQGLNSAVSNSSWDKKRAELLRWSLLPLNKEVSLTEDWTEAAIEARNRELFDRAVQIWPRP